MKPEFCLYPKCKKAPRARGLCISHYVREQQLVKKGKTNWKQLERNKKCLERNKILKVSDWFLERVKA